MKKIILLFAILLACVFESYAQKTVFKFRDAQARAGNAETEVIVKPTVVDVEIQKENGKSKKIVDTWVLSKEEVEIGMEGKLDNIRAWGTYLSVQKHQCDVIMGATFKVEDDEASKGYTLAIRECLPTGILLLRKILNGYRFKSLQEVMRKARKLLS